MTSDVTIHGEAKARQILRQFVSELEVKHAAGEISWDGLGVSIPTVRHLRQGRGVRPETVGIVARAAGLTADTATRAVRAADYLHRAEQSRGWEKRKASGRVRQRYSWFPGLRHRHLTPAGRWLLRELRKGWPSVTAFQRATRIDPYTTSNCTCAALRRVQWRAVRHSPGRPATPWKIRRIAAWCSLVQRDAWCPQRDSNSRYRLEGPMS